MSRSDLELRGSRLARFSSTAGSPEAEVLPIVKSGLEQHEEVSVPTGYLGRIEAACLTNDPSKCWQVQIGSAGGPRSGSSIAAGRVLAQPLGLL